MLTILDTPQYVLDIHSQCQQKASAIYETVQSLGTTKLIEIGENLLNLSDSSMIYIQGGLFRFMEKNKVLRFYGPGEWITGGDLHPEAEATLCSEFAAEVCLFPKENFLEAISANKESRLLWNQYQEVKSRLMHSLCATYMADNMRPEVNFVQYEENQVIVTEGEVANEIFEMVEGEAEVMIKGEPFGTINEGEIFGEMSFFTGRPRAATVIARSPCMVQCLSHDVFLKLMQFRPHTMERLAKTLCERILFLDKKLMEKNL